MGNNLGYVGLEPIHYNLDFDLGTWYSDEYKGRLHMKCWEGTYLPGIL